MSRKFEIERDYYDAGYILYKKKTIEIKHGVTVFVGCNGIGKTTLIHQLKNRLKKENIPSISFDNLNEGGATSRQENFENGDIAFLATASLSSEGENIVMNMGKFAIRLHDFVKQGKDSKRNMFTEIFKSSNDSEEVEIPKERWIFLDAIDSGLSIDNIVDVKQLFNTILEHNFGNEIYIVVSANEYEMASGEQCFDVYNGKYVKFKDYEDYRNLIMKTREIKDYRYKNVQV